MQTGHNTSHTGTQLSDVAICRLVTTRHTLVPNCGMSQCVDWSQHVTHWCPTVGCCNMQTGHNTSHTGAQPSDVAICRLVTTRHTLVPNCQMWQYADWSQDVTHWCPTVGCCNMQTGHNTSHIGAQLSDVAICRLVTARNTLVPNCRMLQYADWSQHVTHWCPTVGCGNMQTGNNMQHTGTQLLDVAICRLVTTHHTLVANCRMWQCADCSQHATHWYPTVGCCNMHTGDNTPHTGTQISDVATCRPVITCHTLVPNYQMWQCVDWSQHATHTGTQLSDVAMCRLVTTRHTLVPNCRMWQCVDW